MRFKGWNIVKCLIAIVEKTLNKTLKKKVYKYIF